MKSKSSKSFVMRDSGIEFLKIMALLLIITYHVMQTLGSSNSYIDYKDYIVDLTIATTSKSRFLLVIFYHFGPWGNLIFFVCSAWFLLENRRVNKKKWMYMLVDIWVVSIIILVAVFIRRNGNVDSVLVVKSFLPTIYGNNWYMTCYLLFYPIHGYLNGMIDRMSQAELLRITISMMLLYFIIDFISTSSLFFISNLVMWTTIYFVVAYLKLYCKEFCSSWRANIVLLLVGGIGQIGLILLYNYLGLETDFFNSKLLSGLGVISKKVLHWSSNSSLFWLMCAIAMLNIARKLPWKSCFVNYLSSLSMLIYIIHENILLRIYYRPKLVNYIYQNFGYEHIVFWVLVLVLMLFLFGTIAGSFYDKILRRKVMKVSDWIYSCLEHTYKILEKYLLRLH